MWIGVDAYRYRTKSFDEWCGHTLGFKAAGSLSVHTTVAVWNAHHAWQIRAKALQCMEKYMEAWDFHSVSLSPDVIATWERAKNWGKESAEFESLITLCSSLGVLITGSKQTAFMSDVWQGDLFSCYPWGVLFCLFESVVLDHCHRGVLKRKRIYWKWAWWPAVTTSIHTMIKWTIGAVLWIESFIAQQEDKAGRTFMMH